jgi:hypothetical protein
MSLIKLASEYGDPRRQASEMPHGLTARQTEEMARRFDNLLPGISNGSNLPARSELQQALPKGANLMRTAQQSSPWGNGGGTPGSMAGGNGKTFFSQQRPYQPEFESPDRQQYPVHRILANRYWRLFYKMDPIVGNCIDMYGDMPWSQFKLTGPGVEGSVLKTMEAMCEETDLLGMLPAMVREFFVVGEVCPHLFFDDDKGYWTHIALHNPDQLEVIDAPFIKMDPIVQFIPDDRLRSVLTSNNPLLRGIREKMPPQLLAQLQARQNIPLSSVNATFIPRKLHPYDTRGTSIFSRLWRIFMYEDAIFNASIQTARRHAGPIKIAKLGNPQTGWIPGPEHEAKLLQLLAQAELDPHAWLVYHYGIEFDTVGTTDRMMSIKAEWDTIERIKLIALGISKSFLHGEVTYASAATGLQVFLQRLKALRTFFEQKWILPKFFQTMAEINGWIRRSPAEINHRFRVKRSQRELIEENRYIRPKIVWEKTLDPAVDANLINAMQVLESMGVKFSKTTKMATVGMSFEEETHKIQQETQFERQFLPKLPSDQQQQPQDGGAGGGAPGGMMAPMGPEGGPGDVPPPGDEGDVGAPPGAPPPPPPPGGGESPAPPPAALHSQGAGGEKKAPPKMQVEKKEVHKPGKSSNSHLTSEIWKDDRFGNWHADEVGDLVELFTEGTTGSPMWARLKDQPAFMHAVQARDADAVWAAVHELLDAENFPEQDIKELRKVLVHEGFLPALEDLENTIELEPGADADDGFLVGSGAKNASRKLSGDVSQRLIEARERVYAAQNKQATKTKKVAPAKKKVSKPRSK